MGPLPIFFYVSFKWTAFSFIPVLAAERPAAQVWLPFVATQLALSPICPPQPLFPLEIADRFSVSFCFVCSFFFFKIPDTREISFMYFEALLSVHTRVGLLCLLGGLILLNYVESLFVPSNFLCPEVYFI